MGEEKSFSQRAFSIYTDRIYRLSNLGNGWGYEMTPAELAKKDEFYSIYWSEYNLVKESGSPELYDKIHNRNNYADI